MSDGSELKVTDTQAAAVQKLIKLLDRFQLRTPAILALESMRPLSFVGSQFMHVLSPAVSMLVPMAEWDQLATLREDRRGIEYVINQLEGRPLKEGQS